MTLIVGPQKWYQVCSGLVTAVVDGLSNTVTRACVVPGAIAWDAADCGQLAVSLGQVNPSNDFPATETLPLGNCTPALEIADIVIQVVRCVPGIGEAADQLGGLAPTCEELDGAAQVVTQDSHELMVSVTNYLQTLRNTVSAIDYITGPTVVMGPEGGIVGNEMRVQVGLPYG